MTSKAAQAVLAVLALGSGSTTAQVINIPPDFFPTEAFFDANPGATVNVCCFDGILPDDEDGDGVFTFNGATVNINDDGESGFFTTDSFIEDAVYNINDGGKLIRTKFVASSGSTSFHLFPGGLARSGLWLQGNTVGMITGGDIGLVASGQAAMIIEDSASCTMSDGDIDTFILIQDNGTFVQSGGTIGGGIQVNDDAIVTVSGGSSGNNGFTRDVGSVLNITGGTIGRDFIAEKGTVNLSGGGMGDNCAIVNSSGVDPVFNMTGGGIGFGFRAFDGTFNLSGGLVGDGFRLGRPTGDGSGVVMNITAKSATIDGAPLVLSATPTTITTRGGAFLSCVLLDDSIVGFDLNEGFVPGEDRFRAAATLTIKLECAADVNGDSSLNDSDFFAWVTAFTASPRSPEQESACDVNRDGSCDDSDFFAWVTVFTGAGCP
ncbi:MAG: dockerin type I domain-containing protein [Planctomycetota bacterium]